MIILPLIATPSQSINIVLNNQPCTYNLYTRGNSMYSDLYVGDNPIWLGRICLGNVSQKQYEHLPFEGDLFWDRDPKWELIGTLCNCYYFSKEEEYALGII